eukprot:5650266-Amphidinium_carterae.1
MPGIIPSHQKRDIRALTEKAWRSYRECDLCSSEHRAVVIKNMRIDLISGLAQAHTMCFLESQTQRCKQRCKCDLLALSAATVLPCSQGAFWSLTA